MLRPPVVESVKKLWDRWNIRGLIILSLFVQSFLILFARLRRKRGGNWIAISIWLAYLLADWVATFAIGLMLRAEVNDILAFWAPFLLLHLGGPDTITSFSLEDNEFWIRHLLGLMLQIGSTVYVILQSLPDNKLWLPTLLVLIAGIIKYAERNRALYLASFDHFEVKQKEPPIQPLTLDRQALGLEFDTVDKNPTAPVKNLLVGPLIPPGIRHLNKEVFLQKQSEEVLLKLETELSLLYEALHTKLPVVCCKVGYVFRIISLGCIFGALLSFGLITKYYHQLGKSEIWLTYGLLIGAITLDFISIGFLFFSDFNLAVRKIPEWKIVAWIKNRPRWSKRIPQGNFITCCVNDCPYWLSKFVNFIHIRNVLGAIKLNRCSSLQHFKVDKVWPFIFEEVRKKAETARTVKERIEICLKRGDGILDSNVDYRHLIWSVRDLDYTKSLLTWHFATELCFHDEDNIDGHISYYRAISKLLSDYMFYLIKMQPGMMSTVSPGWKAVHKRACREVKSFFNNPSSLDGKYFSAAILQLSPDQPDLLFQMPDGPDHGVEDQHSILFYHANKLAHHLKGSYGIPWKLMSQVWVEIMCYAAINCKPNVHARQPSRGGELLTFVWLLMNHLGIGTQFATEEIQSVDDDDIEVSFEPSNQTEVRPLGLARVIEIL